ncbi:MAG: YfhO family protein, partial [Candidatus Methanofastidiosa archaeon]|nr:YfhO family protein [Candidatus Methanofastidiosa archaeon]
MNETIGIKKITIARILVIIVPLSYLLFYLIQGYSILDGNTDRVDAQLTALFAAKNALEVGQLPWWNPYIFNGYPLWGSTSIFLWYPFTWIELLVPQSIMVQTSTAIAWLHYFAVFFTSFVYFREITKDEKWASFSSLAYGFSLPVAYSLSIGNALLPIYVYLPLTLFFLHTYKKRKFANNVLIISLSLYAMITGGFMQLFVYAMIIIGFYSVFLLLDSNSKNEKINLLLMLITSSVIALFLSAPVWLSTLYMSKFISRVVDTGTSLRLVINSNYMADLYQLLRFLAPNGFGYSMYVQDKNISYVETSVVFCGVSSLFLVGIALISSRKRITAFWGIITVLWILSVYSLLELVQYFAFGRMEMMYGRILFLLPLCLASLAGIGGQSLQDIPRLRKWKLVLLNPFILLVMIVIHGNARYIFDLLRNIGDFAAELLRTHRLSLTAEMLPEIELLRVVLVLIFMIIFIVVRKRSNFLWGILIIVLLGEVIPGTYYMNKIQLNPLMISPTSGLFPYDSIKKPI